MSSSSAPQIESGAHEAVHVVKVLLNQSGVSHWPVQYHVTQTIHRGEGWEGGGGCQY